MTGIVLRVELRSRVEHVTAPRPLSANLKNRRSPVQNHTALGDPQEAVIKMIKVQRDREKVGEAQKTSVHRLSLPDLLTKLAENYCQRNAEGLFDYMIFKNLLKYVDFIIHGLFFRSKERSKKAEAEERSKKERKRERSRDRSREKSSSQKRRSKERKKSKERERSKRSTSHRRASEISIDAAARARKISDEPRKEEKKPKKKKKEKVRKVSSF